MSDPGCIRPEALDEVLEAPDDDARRAHARDCPRCTALLDAYRLYRAGGAVASAAEREDARVRLAAALAAELGVAPPATASAAGSRAGRGEPPAPALAGPRRATPRPAAGWWSRLLHPAMRPAWGVAALAAVLAGVLLIPSVRWPGGEPALRGEAPPDAAARVEVVEATITAGGLRLAWRAWPGAEDYEVRLFDASLEPLGRLGPTTDTTLAAPAAALPFAPEAAGSVVFRVHARIGGDVVATSVARPLGPHPGGGAGR